MSKIISIIGPTATGKTSLALEIAEQIINSKKFAGVDIISVDSRQVYKGLEIVSGADIPEGFKAKITGSRNKSGMTVWEKNKVKIHGVSIINPDQEWSLAHFVKMAQKIIISAENKNRLVILVGGTGLYHDKLILANDSELKTNTLGIKPDLNLRKKLEKLSVLELQEILQEKNKNKFESMNDSDRQNPRRLIRAIEIASAKAFTPAGVYPVLRHGAGMTLGLSDSLENINSKIRKRVLERFDNGAVQEVRNLLKNYSNQNLPALSATGVKEISRYLENKFSKQECLEAWTLREYQYAKRQITWWKKKKDISWHKVSDKNYKNKATKKVLDFVL